MWRKVLTCGGRWAIVAPAMDENRRASVEMAELPERWTGPT